MKFDYQKANIYAAAWHAFRVNKLNAAFIALLTLLLPVVGEKFDSFFAESIAPAILGILFAYFIHATILFNLDIGAKTWSAKYVGNKFLPFLMRSFIFFGFVFLASVGILLVGFSTTFSPSVGLLITQIGVVFVLLPLLGVLFSVFGTMLPAAVEGKNASFAASKARAKGLFWYTYSGLLLGPTLFTIVVVALFYGLEKIEVTIDIFDTNGSFSPEGLIISYILGLVSLFNTALAATVLCKTYLKSEQSTAPEEPSSAAP